MAYWNGNKLVYFKPEPVKDYPDWEIIDCGCCNGLQWGGDSPRNCPDCGGGGHLFRHIKSGALAEYPGGPFLGRE